MKKELVRGYKKVDKQWIKIINSKVHGKGLIAAKPIPKDTQIIEYVGEIITKKESDNRAELVLDASKDDSTRGAVYIFTLNKRYDIDGNVAWNPARLINHSCDPNSEAINIDGEIWICAMRDIKAGEELNYNYGYDIEDYKEHPCRCGSHNCIGYIAEESLWPKLQVLIDKK